MKKRDARFEELRLLSMLMIVILHVMNYGGVHDLYNETSVAGMLLNLIRAYSYLGVNCFVLISSYFMTGKRFDEKRIGNFVLNVLFYSITSVLVSMMLFGRILEKTELLKAMFPLSSGIWWFASVYFVMLLVMPILNNCIDTMTKRQHEMSIMMLFIVFSLLPTVLIWAKAQYSSGTDLAWFITLYFTGTYLRKYGVPDIRILHTSRNCVLLSIGCCMLTMLAETLGITVGSLLGKSISKILYYNNQPLLFVGAVLTFMAFIKKKENNTKIADICANIGSLTFGVYLFHDNPLIKEDMWSILTEVFQLKTAGIGHSLLSLIGAATVIYVIGIVWGYIQRITFTILNINKITEKMVRYLRKFVKRYLVKYL